MIEDINKTEEALTGLSMDEVTFTGPDGNEYTIRESNGNDEKVLANPSNNNRINDFVSRILVAPKLNTNEVAALKVRVKWYILFKWRLFNLGNEITFDYVFGKDVEPYNLEEDLSIFDDDFSKYDDEDHERNKLAPLYYNTDEEEVFFTLSSGRECSFEYLTGNHELSQLAKLKSRKGKNPTSFDINEELIIRNFKVKHGSTYRKIEMFNVFKTREMKEIRSNIDKYDKEWSCQMILENPGDGPNEVTSAFLLDDFFFPRD